MSYADSKQAATSTITLKIPAKLNLYLQAGLLREDGYHDMTTVYQAISLYDTLTISLIRTQALHGFTMTVTGVDSDRIPANADNLVIKAAQRLSDYLGTEPESKLHFELVKAIPSQAGLGGGSADAAAALVGCNILWKAGVCEEDLMAIGAQIGEDVPFFIKGMVALGTGHKAPLVRLETTRTSTSTWHWVLGILPAGLSTKDVFGKFEEQVNRKGFDELTYQARHEACMRIAWASAPPQLLAAALANDLEEVSMQLLPELGLALQAGKAAGALASLMAGAGTTCAFLARDQDDASNLAVKLLQENLFRDVTRVVGPVEGIQVL